MERRTSQRKPIYLEAELSWQKRVNWPCTIEDFCAEGMFIRFDQSNLDQISGIYSKQANNAMNVAFKVDDRSFNILVKPVRMAHAAMGVRFLEAHPDAFAAMLLECSRNTDPAQVISENSKAAFVTRQFTKTLHQRLKPLLETFFYTLEENLRDAANHSAADQLANQLIDSVSLIARSQPAITASFLDNLVSPAKTPPAKTQSNDSLSLIDRTEFEDWLTIKVMITKAEAQYHGTLLQLKMRLDKVGIVNATGHQNPYGPDMICYAFKAASAPLNLLKQPEKIYYKIFETEVLQHLDALYTELNQILIRQNILPDLKLNQYLSGRKNRLAPAATDKRTKDDDAKIGTGKNPQQEAADAVQNLQTQRQRQASAGFAGNSNALPTAEAAEVFSDKHENFSAFGQERGQLASSRSATGPFSVGDTFSPMPESRRIANTPEPNREEQFQKALVPPFSNDSSVADLQARLSTNLSNAESVFKSVQGLFSVLDKTRQGKSAKADSVPVSDLPKWSPAELQNSLQRLQKLTARGQVNTDVRDEKLADRVISDLRTEGAEEKVLDGEQKETLDVVDRFFLGMVSSEKITDQVKSQLVKLQVPVLKVLLKDKAFLERKDSPVRVLLNRIAQLGLKGGRFSPVTQQKIDSVIYRINEEFEQDINVFDEAVAELDEVIDRQNLLYRRNVERVMSAAEGSQKVDLAKKVVAEEIKKRTAGRHIPKAVVTLINGGWRDLLSLTYIRQGEGSQAWQDYLNVIDTLIAYGDNPHMDVNLVELLKTIQEGLSSISSNHMPSGHIRDQLKQFIVGSKERPPEMIEMPGTTSAEQERDKRLSRDRYRGLQRWIHRAQKLAVGSWIKHIKNKEDPVFMRLVWIGKGFSKFVFVNHQGMKVIELELLKLAGMMHRGVLVHDSTYETPIVDESLDNMVKSVYEQLSFVTTHDEITGLVNRKEIERNIKKKLAKGTEDGSCNLIYIDLRQFRIINDHAGYDAGDQLLKEVAGIIRSCAPEGAILARMGGNEFAVLTDKPEAEALGRKLLTAIEEHEFQWKDAEYPVSANIGIAVSSEYLTNTESLLGAAESACRSAKKLGPNRLSIHNPDKNSLSRQKQIVAKVAGFKDLDKERILLRCQKIIPLHMSSKLNTHYQILLSVYDDNGHLIPASEFVRTAEHYNRMKTVDCWVIGHMMDWIAENQAVFQRMGGVSINLTGHSLNDDSLLEVVYDRLSKRKSPLERVCFEITDASEISNINDVADFIRELKETGCLFSLGSFGAGISSHSLLKSLPVDLIKIDGSFVKDLSNSPDDRVMVKSMTEMAHLMGKEVVACQVEDKPTLEMIRWLGVDYAQGYGIEKPRLINTI
ncbi:MAG: signal transduction protein [Gammaproteobacteria bacterium]|nr:MAG: signal transduction protein [Gammaproteobacteria bacterium]